MQRIRLGDGAELSYSESGSGLPAMIFIHGWQGDSMAWRDVIGALRSGAHVIAVDLRGNGESRGARGPYRLERFAADLRELIESLHAAPAVLVGHSMGATVALRLAVDSPELVGGLVLIAPVPASGGGYSEKGEAFLRATAGDPVAARNWLARTFAVAPDDAILERLCAAAAKTDPDVALECFESWAHADFAEETRAIEAPALVIAPEHDRPDVVEGNVAALLPNSQFVVLPGAAHYAIIEKAGEIAAMIGEFVPSFDTPALRAAQDHTEDSSFDTPALRAAQDDTEDSPFDTPALRAAQDHTVK
jgi:pimeloyl-ACP methyl ester carboxylesterase